MKYLVILCFFCLISNTSVGDAPQPTVRRTVPMKQVESAENNKRILKIDTATIKIRVFNTKALAKYRAQKEFIYDDVAPAHESLWSKFWRSVWRVVDQTFSNSMSGNFMKYVLLALIIGLAVFAVLKITGLDLKIFAGKSKTLEIPYEESLENIHEINFDEEIEQAIARIHYRLAVRLLYLRTLKILNDQNMIHWQPQKTNQTYVREIEDQEMKAKFAILTHKFEYVWYGDFAIDRNNFNQIREIFQQFNLKKS